MTCLFPFLRTVIIFLSYLNSFKLLKPVVHTEESLQRTNNPDLALQDDSYPFKTTQNFTHLRQLQGLCYAPVRYTHKVCLQD